MPYSGPGDPSLPDYIKKLPAKKKRQWVSVFNSVMSRGGDESSAFRQANGVVKELSVDLEAVAQQAGAGAEFKALMDKCGAYMPAEAVQVYRPLGGATSWDEADSVERAQHLQHEADELMWMMRQITGNIMDDPELSASGKASALRAAADEFASRAGDLGDEVEDQEKKKVLELPDDLDVDALDDVEVAALFQEAGVKEFEWKARRYIDSADQAPPGVQVQKGPRGGLFYESSLARKRPAKPASALNRPVAPKPAASPANVTGLITSLRQLIARLGRGGRQPAGVGLKEADPLNEYLAGLIDPDAPQFGSFTVTKDAQGKWRWVAVYSNKWYDRDKEVFPESEHKAFVDWVDRTKAFPELWLWHTPGSRVGQADWVDYSSGGFALASGGFDKNMDDVAEVLSSDRDLGVSHGFKFRDIASDGAYKGYRSFEISPLPARKAANPGTAFSAAMKEATMLSAEKRTWLVAKMGEDRVKQIETVLGVMSKEMTEKGVSFKEVMDEFAATSGSPVADAAKSVPPNSSEATPPGNQTTLTLEAVKVAIGEAVKEHVDPLTARIGELEKAAKPPAGDFTARVTPAAAARSADSAKSSDIQSSDPLYEMAKAAEEQLAAAQELDDPKLPAEVAWHIAALGHAGVVSANGAGVPAGA